ncbi:MAG TPA: hypothetical protein VGB30_00440 [bacterium]|jgi:hypothetical protein
MAGTRQYTSNLRTTSDLVVNGLEGIFFTVDFFTGICFVAAVLELDLSTLLLFVRDSLLSEAISPGDNFLLRVPVFLRSSDGCRSARGRFEYLFN